MTFQTSQERKLHHHRLTDFVNCGIHTYTHTHTRTDGGHTPVHHNGIYELTDLKATAHTNVIAIGDLFKHLSGCAIAPLLVFLLINENCEVPHLFAFI